MNCALENLIALVPPWMRSDVDKHGQNNLEEIRLRLHKPAELVTTAGIVCLNRKVRKEDMEYCINAASRYSPWTASTTANGYITAEGGHRIGICGEAVVSDGKMTGIRTPTMLCIRIARNYVGIAKGIPYQNNSVLIIGKPGSGKTTLLRDLIRNYSNTMAGSISVVDERREIFPFAKGECVFSAGDHTDILSGCKKSVGIDCVLRAMGPSAIAIDEITAEEDTQALQQAAYCGVHLFATAHAGSKAEFMQRKVYQPIIESQIFDTLVVLNADKHWCLERIRL